MNRYLKIILGIIIAGSVVFGILYTRDNSLETQINRSILNWYFNNISLTENTVDEYKTENEKESKIKWYKVIKELNSDWDFVVEDFTMYDIGTTDRIIDHSVMFESNKTNELRIFRNRYYSDENTYDPIPLTEQDISKGGTSKPTSNTKTLWEGDFDSICIDPKHNDSEKVDYEPTVLNVNEYEEYFLYVDTLCPFVSTVETSKCLDNEIDKQTQRYNFLEKEILAKAKSDSEQAKTQNTEADLSVSRILKELPEYTKIKDDYIISVCSIKNYSITGTAIVEESRKCIMYYNYKNIQMLESIASSI
jgi:hypothetical protein